MKTQNHEIKTKKHEYFYIKDARINKMKRFVLIVVAELLAISGSTGSVIPLALIEYKEMESTKFAKDVRFSDFDDLITTIVSQGDLKVTVETSTFKGLC